MVSEKTILLTLFAIIIGCGHSIRKAKTPTATVPTTRQIKTCVLNDLISPAPEELINSEFKAVSDEYNSKVGISFEGTKIIPFNYDIEADAIDIAFYLDLVCPKESELRFIFSNRATVSSGLSGYYIPNNEVKQYAGRSHDYFGFLVLYEAEDRAKITDEGGNRAVHTTLLHEIGHLFKLDHLTDKNSFMYSPSCYSQGEWTKEVINTINREKHRRWYPRL
jgi:hypothetical protein